MIIRISGQTDSRQVQLIRRKKTVFTARDLMDFQVTGVVAALLAGAPPSTCMAVARKKPAIPRMSTLDRFDSGRP